MEKCVAVATTMLVLVLASLQTDVANAETILVGGHKNGWDFDVFSWSGKTFKAGDTLVFQYDPAIHNLVIVDKKSYDTCTVPPNAKIYTSGYDKITLAKGPNYFICGIMGQCDAGLQLTVYGA